MKMRELRSQAARYLPVAAVVVSLVAACGQVQDQDASVFPGIATNDGAADVIVSDASAGDGDDASLPTLFGDDGGDATLPAPQALYFDPPAATVVVDGTGPQTAHFALKAVDANGNTTEVLAESVDFDRPDLAGMTASDPIVATAPPASATGTPYAGTGTLHAVYRGKEATATLTVQVHLVDYGPGLVATSPAVVALGAAGALPADPAQGIAPLLYPYDGTVWPLGLTSPLVMWNAPQAGDVYRMHYAEKNYVFDGYYTLATLPGQLRLAQEAWDRITASSDAKNGPDPLAFSLSRWDHGTGVAYASATETWTIAPESLRGAIYYWTASQDAAGTRIGHISRFRPGTGAVPQPLNNGTCMGCHAVNAQGTILVADVDDQVNDGVAGAQHTVPSVAPYDNWSGTRAWASFDITQPAAPLTYQSTEFGGNVALTPDGKYVVFGGPASPAGSLYLSLGDPLTGQVVATSGLDAVTGFGASDTNLEMPAFSPDGTMLAVVESNSPGDRDNVIPQQPEVIAYLGFHESGPTFDPTLNPIVDGTSPAFATSGGGLGYPSFTPDSKAIAYHAGTTSTGCHGACDDTVTDDGDLFVSLVAGGAPIRLAAADDPPAAKDRHASVEPTFNPVARGGYSWAVFTSMRDWGNQPWPSDVTSTGHVNGKRRLWLTAVDTSIGTTDPSHPAIYLEGQEDTPNMRGFFALAQCTPSAGAGAGTDAGTDAGADAGAPVVDGGAACGSGFECCSGFCEKGVCKDVSKISCSGVGSSCTTAADCCNGGTGVVCLAGACTIESTR